ncbi:hypothetical protein JMJ35_003475 [Cladonia borealis]|uniref:Uncharacterized protein n=1 Tax=Cladonia borealis TaxID=184061 RepID=A0AA39R2M6_9LECA|nr:hypothetical protein JMJ35_003475 [Cladonia borealis]
MLLTHGPFVSLSYTVILFAPFTWASLPPRQAVPISAGAAYSLPSVPTLAPGWSPSPPVWSSPTPASSTTAPVGAYGYPPEPTTCTPWAQCNVFYQWVTVLYWPQSTQNTACIPQATGVPPTPLPAGIVENSLQSPSVYAIFGSIRATDGCTQVGTTFKDFTTSFAPGDLSTVDSSGATKVFDFGDLPCGPSGTEDISYAPTIAPPSFIFNELDNGAFATCIPGADQGIDPPIAVQGGGGVSGPGGGGRPGRNRRAPANAAAVPTPVIT